MAKSVYSRQKTGFGGSFASDLASMSLAGSVTPLGIVQNVQIQFSQQVARIYDVSNGGTSGAGGGKVPVFYVGGRTQGQGTIARVLGQDLTFTFRGGCGPSGTGRKPTTQLELANKTVGGNKEFNTVAYTIIATVMTNLGITVGSQDMIVNENITLMFANLECNDDVQ
jgi:hypothetical protein